MIFNETNIYGVYIIDTEPRFDERGFFARTFCSKEFQDHNINMNIVQINMSHNIKKGTLRGLHLQKSPNQETKIVKCIKGEIFDVAVDVRPESKTFGQYVSAVLSEKNGRMLVIPKGFAHGYLSLLDGSDVIYFVDEFYSPESEMGYRYDEPLFNIDWPLSENLIITNKDLSLGNIR